LWNLHTGRRGFLRLGGYEKLIRKALMTAGLRGLNIFNHGRNGAALQDVQSGGDEWRTFPYHAWLQIEKPTIVVIFAGTNDVRNYPHIEYFEVMHLKCGTVAQVWHQEPENRLLALILVSHTQPTLTEMIDQAKSINATVIVSTLL
jgi:lysophospholipase L1-like esterase